MIPFGIIDVLLLRVLTFWGKKLRAGGGGTAPSFSPLATALGKSRKFKAFSDVLLETGNH